MGILSLFGSFAATVFIGVTLHLVNNAIPKLLLIVICYAASRLPAEDRETQKAAWLADFALLTTDIERIRCAFGCVSTSLAIERPGSVILSRQKLESEKNCLTLLAAMLVWSGRRLGKIGITDKRGTLGFQRKYLLALMFASARLMKPRLKSYCERWIEHNQRYPSRKFETVEQVQMAMLEPITREVNVYRVVNSTKIKGLLD